MLTLFYDSACPLCVREMRALKEFDTSGNIKLVDLRTPEYMQYPQVEYESAMTVLHGIDDQGRLLRGLDVTAAAWKAVGKNSWIQILRWPIIRTVADVCYLLFARNRYAISWLLTGQSRCDGVDCRVKNSKTQ